MTDLQLQNLSALISLPKVKATAHFKVLDSISKDPIIYSDGVDVLLQALGSTEFSLRSLTSGQRSNLVASIRELYKTFRKDYLKALHHISKIQPSPKLRRLAGNKVNKYTKTKRVKKNIKPSSIKTIRELEYVLVAMRTQSETLLFLSKSDLTERFEELGLKLKSRKPYGGGRIPNEEYLEFDPKLSRKSGQLELRLITHWSSIAIRPAYVSLVLSSKDPNLVKNGAYPVFFFDGTSKRALKFFKDDQLPTALRYMNKLKDFIGDP